ncbi:hypothetical protein MUB24_04415 [Lederbergia sp. NSJ-179]|uniref:hypothetical protein n=1 Tax=Lederbergia sp. NSJ-179 TaxID=2931402 RepID=UPI001FD287B9|nr:hypothetical protein [Lederbergia sp. NSJ-179]MCJ7840166.1 hypothetical protein [Lederbergia sp. NSJ-179]
MNKQFALIFLTFVVCFSFSIPSIAAEKGKAILEYKHDVTGDGKPDEIMVYGIPFKGGSPYYQKVWAEIITSEGQKLKIDYEGGYEPKLDFADLNHDGVKDILYSSATGGSGGIYNYALHTAKGGKVKEIPLPTPLAIQGYFDQDFVAVIKIPGMKNAITLDLWSRRKDYISTGLYQKNGQLNEPTELMIDPIAFFEVIKIKDKEGFGLKGYRQISGAYHADQLGVVETEWYFENGEWHPVHIEWKATDYKKKEKKNR